MDDYYSDPSGFFVAAALTILFISIAGYVIVSFLNMKLFDKAGVQGKWRAWVPIYNMMIFFKLGDLSPWLVLYAVGGIALLSWIPLIGQLLGVAAFALTVVAAWRVGLKLQKEAVWVVLYVFVSVVWTAINAFDKSRWNPNIAPAPWAGNSFLADRTVWEGIPVQPSASLAPQGYGYAQPGYPQAPQGYQPPGYPQAPQGYQPPGQPGYPPAPQGYQPPAQPGYPQAPQGYQPPAQPGYAAPASPTGPSIPPEPPTTPPAPPMTPPEPPTAPPAPPTAPPVPPATEPDTPNNPPA